MQVVNIEQFYRRHFGREDRLILSLEMFLIFSGLIYMLLNRLTFKYFGTHYVTAIWLWIIPSLLLLVIGSSYFFKMAPRTAFLLKSYSLYFLAFFAFLVMLSGVQYTPFPIVDNYLAKADEVMHINEVALLDWTYAHPLLLKILTWSYHSVMVQLLIMPLLLFILGKKDHFHFYMVVSLIAYILGAMIYYFFPTVGPAGVFSDSHFTTTQLDNVIKFKEIHQYLLLSTFEGGTIICPSFHILWSVIIIHTLYLARTWLFYPAFILNSGAIIATILLGWNYAIDVAGGGFLAWIAIYLAKRLFKSVTTSS